MSEPSRETGSESTSLASSAPQSPMPEETSLTKSKSAELAVEEATTKIDNALFSSSPDIQIPVVEPMDSIERMEEVEPESVGITIPAAGGGDKRSSGGGGSPSRGNTPVMLIPKASSSSDGFLHIEKASRSHSETIPVPEVKKSVKAAIGGKPKKGGRNSADLEPPKRLKSILKVSDPNDFTISRSNSQNRVNFKRRLEFYNENNMDLVSLSKYIINTVFVHFPLWHDGVFETPWNTQPVLQLTIPTFRPTECAFFISVLLLPYLYPMITVLIPAKSTSDGAVTDHLAFSLLGMTLLGLPLSVFSVLWLEQFSNTLIAKRLVLMFVVPPLGALFHLLMSFALGMMLPYGPDLVAVFNVVVVQSAGYFLLPDSIRRQRGMKNRVTIGTIMLVVSFASVNLISLMESAGSRGAQVCYLLVFILPILFTRLTTDIQEALPYASSSFAVISQGLLVWMFSATTYSLLLFLSEDVDYWKLFLVYLVMDMACVCCVGPIWSLWKETGFLKTSRYLQTIFGWAQNPIKPRPILLKYATRVVASTAFPVVLSVVHASSNNASFTFSKKMNGQKLGALWIAMIIECVISSVWIVFMYRLMKVRCSKESFNEIIIHFSKNITYIILGGTVVTLMAFMVKSLPGNSGYL